MTVTTQDMREAWAPPCNYPALVTIPFGTHGARISVERRAVPAFMVLALIMEAHGYVIRPGVTGAANCRIITGGTLYSLHAFWIAVDVNWDRNPYGPRLITDMPPEMIRDIEALRTGNGKQVFRWGGRYSGNRDAMHFELIVTPADLATGIVGGPTTGDIVTPEQMKELNKGTAMIVGAATAKIIDQNQHQTTRLLRGIWRAAGKTQEEIAALEQSDADDPDTPTGPAPTAAEIADEVLASLGEKLTPPAG